MSNLFRGAIAAIIISLSAGLAVVPARQAPDELLTNAGWECVEGARVVDGKVVMTAGATSLGTLNDYAVRLETRPDVTISLTIEATAETGFAGLNFWNSQPKPGDATSWYQTAAKIVLGLSSGRVFMRVFDGSGPTPAFQYSGREAGVTGPIALSVGRENDALVLRVAGAEAARTTVLGPLTGGPLFFGPNVAANKTLTLHRLTVTDGAHPGGAAIVRGAPPATAASVESSAAATLRAAAAARNRDIGVGLVQRPLRWDQQIRDVAAREFNLLSSVDAFMFRTMHPARDQYRFCGADQAVAFAEANKMRVHAGSGVLWGQNPAWLTDGHFSRAELIDILHDHIRTVVGRYRGRVQLWNIVNEVHEFNNTGRLATGDQQIWMRVIGPEYIDMAFRWAHEADPDAVLLFNSAGDEGTGCALHCGAGNPAGSRNRKADALYDFVKGMRQRGVPIHGVGMQTHWGAMEGYPTADPKTVGAQMKRLGDLGLDVYITEMDVAIQKPVTPAKLADQAKIYGTTMRTCLAAPNCKGVIVFGTDDGDWSEPPSMARSNSPLQGQLTAPLLFDAAFRPKAAYDAIAAALRGR